MAKITIELSDEDLKRAAKELGLDDIIPPIAQETLFSSNVFISKEYADEVIEEDAATLRLPLAVLYLTKLSQEIRNVLNTQRNGKR